jgi:Flp pilus assembly pilin Flp
LIAALVGVAAVGAMTTLGGGINTIFQTTTAAMNTAIVPVP